LISGIANSGVGCKLSGHFVNVLAYADDIVLVAPSWKASQQLLNVLHTMATAIDMECNIKKTVAVIFPPRNRARVIATKFPLLKVGDSYTVSQ